MFKFFKNLSLVAMSFVSSFLFAEVVLRFTEYQYILAEPAHGIPQGYYVNDQELGFRIASNLDAVAHQFAGPPYDIFSNEFGCFDRPLEEELTGIVIGDSFTWGFAPLANKWTTGIERLAGDRLLKCGVSGTGTAYQYRWLQRLIEQGLKPDYVVLLYTSNDWNDDLMYDDNTVFDGHRISKIHNINLLDGEIKLRDPAQIVRTMDRKKKKIAEGRTKSQSIIVEMVKKYTKRDLAASITEIKDMSYKYMVNLWHLKNEINDKGEIRPWLQRSLLQHTQTIFALSQYCIDKGIDFYFIDYSRQLRRHKITDDLITERSKDPKFHYLELTQAMQRKNSEKTRYRWLYNSHWNNFGNKLAGGIIAEYIDEYIEENHHEERRNKCGDRCLTGP